MTDDRLEDFAAREIALHGVAKRVYVAGSGRAVIVMTEMPGISPQVARFSRWVRDAGFTVYMPSLFGRDGAVPGVEEGVAVFQKACVSAEFRAFAGGQSSPVTRWLRALARLAHEECGGPGVGAIGMCFTGNFALTMMLEPSMLAPVLCQPTLPLEEPGGLEISPGELAAVRGRLEREDLDVMAYRFEGDRFCTVQRFAAYAEALGERFVGRVLPDSAANPDTAPFFQKYVPCPHSVVTAHLIDREGEPTIAARDEILELFRRRLWSRAGVTIQITRFVSGDQPGWVELRLTDAENRTWTFVEKVPVVTAENLGAGSIFPRQTVIECTVVADVAHGVVRIDTSRPWAIESTDGQTVFDVPAHQVVQR